MMKIKKVFSLIAVMIFLCQNISFGIQEGNFALRPPSHFSQATEEFIRSQNESGYAFMPGELLQFKGEEGVLLTGDYGSGKSGLAIKILDNDKQWECVSCGASDVKAVDLGGKKDSFRKAQERG